MSEYSVTVKIFDGEEYDGDWPTQGYPGRLTDAIAWFQSKLNKIPERFRSEAGCNISSVGGYEGEHHGCISVWYTRPETSSEQRKRLGADKAKADSRRAAELELLAGLKAKYPEAAK